MIRVEVLEFRENFPVQDEAYALLRGEDGRYAFAWGPKYPFADEVPAENVPDGESGIEWYDTEDAARTAMNAAMEACGDIGLSQRRVEDKEVKFREHIRHCIERDGGYTFSEGTLNPAHLLETAAGLLVQHSINFTLLGRIELCSPGEEPGLWEEVFEYFEELSPEGCYFGSLEGDGACIGWWKYPRDDD